MSTDYTIEAKATVTFRNGSAALVEALEKMDTEFAYGYGTVEVQTWNPSEPAAVLELYVSDEHISYVNQFIDAVNEFVNLAEGARLDIDIRTINADEPFADNAVTHHHGNGIASTDDMIVESFSVFR